MDARDVSPDLADGALLRRFAEAGDERAFALLVERHGGLVLGVACRSLQDRGEAEEAAQRVFIAFARKAPDLLGAPSVAAWLHRAATLESLKLRREQRRRHERIEAMSAKQIPGAEGEPESVWSGQLDEAMDKLGHKEREVLVMHFLEGRSFVEIARDLKLSADAVRKRSERALARMAHLLGRREAAVGAVALAALLTSQKAEALSPTLAKSWAAKSIASCTAPTGASLFTKTFIAMKTGKTGFILVALLAAALPISFQAARSAMLTPQAAPGAGGSVPVTGTRASHAAKRSKASLTADELADAFRRLESGAEPAPEVELALRRLVFTLDPAELKIARELLASVEKHERFREIALAVYARWAESEPREATAAAAAAMTRFGYYPLRGAFGTWAAVEPDAALGWLVQTGKEGSPFDLQFLAYEWTRKLVHENPESALNIAKSIGSSMPDWSSAVMQTVMEEWAQSDPAASQTWLEGALKDRTSAERDEAWVGWVKAAGATHPQDALAEAQRIEAGPRRNEAMWGVIWSWGRECPEAFHAYISQPGILEAWDADSVGTAAEALARNRVADAMRMSSRFGPGLKRDEFLDGVLRAALYVEPSQLAPVAAELSDDYVANVNTGAFNSFITEWAKRDPAATERWVNALPEGTRKVHGGMALQNAKGGKR